MARGTGELETAINVRENVSLAPLTTLKIGGPARFFAAARSEGEVRRAFSFASERGLDVFVLGGGSNVLVSDDGFAGLVVHVDIRGVDYESIDASPDVFVLAGAGEDWDALAAETVRLNLAGFECLSGIPGSVGGTPVQNVGAYGQEVSETIVSVRCFDRRAGDFVDLSGEQCRFDYRRSVFNSADRGRYVVVLVKYRLRRGGRPKLIYKELREILSGREPSLSEVRSAVLDIRRKKSMVIDAGDENSQSAGSFFKNPIVAAYKVEALRSIGGRDMPLFPAGDEKFKVPAAWLIENAGFKKAFRLGRAGISANHSLALVNYGGATAGEIIALKELIQAAVREKFDIELQPEPVFVGF